MDLRHRIYFQLTGPFRKLLAAHNAERNAAIKAGEDALRAQVHPEARVAAKVRGGTGVWLPKGAVVANAKIWKQVHADAAGCYWLPRKNSSAGKAAAQMLASLPLVPDAALFVKRHFRGFAADDLVNCADGTRFIRAVLGQLAGKTVLCLPDSKHNQALLGTSTPAGAKLLKASAVMAMYEAQEKADRKVASAA